MNEHQAHLYQSTETIDFLCGRIVKSATKFIAGQHINLSNKNTTSFREFKTNGNASLEFGEQSLVAKFDKPGNTHQLKISLPTKHRGNGVYARIRLNEWKSIKYLAFGYTHEETFRHIKVTNPAQRQWIIIHLQHGDIGYGLQNNWEHPSSTDFNDLRIYLRAEPMDNGASVELEHFVCWEEADNSATGPTSATLPLALPDRTLVPHGLLDVLYGYLRKCFRHVQTQAEEFLQSGRCPLYGETQLEWPLHQALPDGLSTVGTYAFSWHSLHPASILMVHSKNTGMDAPVFAAREMVTNWLERSYYTPDPDKKFAWYDHGTAERQLAFILMWAEGIERKFDERFMSRLGGAIIRHAELLESEQFYASHQPTRYHNHAWFQDLALMATALALPDWPASPRWMQRAIERLTDQLETLIVRDNGFSVFVENSIGYHQGVQRIVELAGDMVRLTGAESSIPDVAVELSRFSAFFRYPDNRAPAQGDTFRRSNPQGDAVRKLKPYPDPGSVVLPKAGYGIVKGNHEGARFMFSMFATSLCKTHKHEDNLSFTLFFDGIEWLIDPSFFSHEYKSPVPAYLRSSAAHNNIFIADKDYSIEPGLASLDGAIEGDHFHFVGEHRCYADTIINRSVKGSSSALSLSFNDEVSSKDARTTDASLMLHCGEGVEVNQIDNIVRLTHPDSQFELKIELPHTQILINHNHLSTDLIRGISGTGFMQSTGINTIECPIPAGISVEWSLSASARLDAND